MACRYCLSLTPWSPLTYSREVVKISGLSRTTLGRESPRHALAMKVIEHVNLNRAAGFGLHQCNFCALQVPLAAMQSSLLKGKRFLGETAQFGRGNGTKTQALFGKGGTKQLKKSSPSKPAKQASKSVTQLANKIKPKGANKKLPVAPAGGNRRTRGSNFQGKACIPVKIEQSAPA